MSKACFEILRSGINTTYQDIGRPQLYHIGIPFSGAMDKRNFLIANKLVGNNLKSATIEFALQGPLLKLKNSEVVFAITGNVKFNIIRKNSNIEKGICYKTYNLKHDENEYGRLQDRLNKIVLIAKFFLIFEKMDAQLSRK